MSNSESGQGAARPTDECPVCSEVSLARQRHWFWVFAEKLGDGAFLTRLGTGGGYCVRHARELLLHEQGERTARGFQFVLRGWRAGLGASMRLDCPACRIEAETEAYVLRLLSRGLWSGDQQTRLDPDALSCLPHARMLLEQAQEGILPEALKRLGATVDRVRAGDGGSQAEIHTAIGHGYDETFRRPERCDTDATAVLSFDAADRALAQGWCPLCLAGREASENVIGWLGHPDRTDRDQDDFARLCPAHLWDAAANDPEASARTMQRIRRTWIRSLGGLEALVEGAAQSDRKGRSGNGSRSRFRGWLERAFPKRSREVQFRRILVEEECVACVAAVTAVDRGIALLDAYLLDTDRSDWYLRSSGVCLQHAYAAIPHLGEQPALIVTDRAKTLIARTMWGLDEAIRKVSWSVRYEPSGEETETWREAVVLTVGRGVLCSDWLAPVLQRPERAV
ncbi:MAG: hypothetical protein GXP34_03015 [Actinobacteria bacterium]|nr:hypothetical protein [Actinomycetota bacterium]